MSLTLLGCGRGSGIGTGGSVTYATFDGAVTNATLSNGNLTSSHNSGLLSLARTTAQKNSGKWYFEVTAVSGIAGQNQCIAVVANGATDFRVIQSGLDGGIVFQGLSGIIFSNDASSGLSLGSSITNGDIIGVAVDLDNDKIWFRKAPSGNWNGQVIGSQNPAGNVGGASMSNYSATTVGPVVGFDTSSSVGVWTANFGASAFTGTVPSGFTSGWTV